MPHSPIILSSGHETLMKETKYRVSLLRKVLRALKLLKLKTSTQLEVSLSKDQVITNYFLSADIVLDNVFNTNAWLIAIVNLLRTVSLHNDPKV